MPIFTVIVNNKLDRMIRTAASNVDNQLLTGETAILGAYPKSEFKLVNNVPIELTQTELDTENSIRVAAQINPQTIITAFAKEVEKNGLATRQVLSDEKKWTKTDAKNAIDQAAGRARARAVSQGALIGEEYNQAAQQVATWRSNGSPVNNIPVMLQSRADSSAISVELAAQGIELAAANYQLLFEKTFDIRLKGKAAVNIATELFADVAQPFITQLNALGI